MDINLRQRGFFNRKAEEWDELYSPDENKLNMIAELLNLKEFDSIMDVATGTGVMIPYLLKYISSRGKIVAVDYSKRMIEIARNKFPKKEYTNVHFIISDVNNLKLNGEFNAILLYSCLPHFPDKKGTIKHLIKGLSNKGILLIAHSQSRNDINNFHREAGNEVCKDHLPPSECICEMMTCSGLNIERTIDNSEMFIIMGKKHNNKIV